ncbi:hypothetical protein [Glaciecola sp. MF2-115]|uniref:hypothetical protein n=1 Tax=Glaciecola sp. MF2-115 TaxID=3384827 RepID=UPI0039A1C3BC
MTKDEFRIIVEGSLNEAIDQARLHLNSDVPKNNIRLINLNDELASGWENSIEFLTEHMFIDEQRIKPCADLIIESFDKHTTTIRVYISGHEARQFGLNWANGVGPFIKGINTELIDKYSQGSS